ncbi:cyclase family protein [Thermoleophilia bacterium SCSIO 60948]|nr:cyclase family protein [Thermoleophilia bacterium SCSIO 60948]
MAGLDPQAAPRPLHHGWIDATVPVSDGMLSWPDDPDVEITYSMAISDGGPANVTKLSMSAHTGTHMDAPHHFIDDGSGIDILPLEAVMGPLRLIEISGETITAAELGPYDPRPGERIAFKTKNSERRWWEEPFDPGFAHIEPDAATLLAERGVMTVGVDYLSVGGGDTGAETHLTLLGAGIWIIEGLALAGLDAGEYELLALPLRLVGRDGSSCRALLRAV